jgi:uncharacterized DUF497 family protein
MTWWTRSSYQIPDTSPASSHYGETISVKAALLLTTFGMSCACRKSSGESVTFGISQLQRLLVVAQTNRDAGTRIISARLMTRKEKVIYAEG